MRAQRFSFGRLSNVDIRLLRVFATIVESGGFGEAQEELGAAASTVSTDMANLERRLGVRLCTRGRGGFALTEKGRAVYEEAGRLFAAVEAFGSSVAALKGQLVGELKIGIIDNSVFDPTTRMPDAIYHFTARYPDVHFTVEVLSSGEIEAAVFEGRLHLGIGVFPRRRAGLNYVASFSETLDLYCGRNHALFGKAAAEISEEDLAGAGYARGIYLPRRPPDDAPFLAAPSATTYQAEGLAFLIQSGRYIGYLPRRYAAIWVEHGWMRSLLPERFSREADFHVITRKGAEPTPVLRAFLEELGGETAGPATRRKPLTTC
jgi:DNA-binding transcriptional LysR family regulator